MVAELDKTNLPVENLDPWNWYQQYKSLTSLIKQHEDQRDSI